MRSPLAALAAAGLVAAATPAHAAGSLNLYPDPTTMIVIIVAFLVLVTPLNALLFKPLFRAMDERDERIAGARRRGEKLQAEAEQVLARYRDAVAEVRDESERDRREHVEAARQEHAQVTGEARREAESEIERSRGEIHRSLDEARASLRASAEPLARDAASRILGRSLS